MTSEIMQEMIEEEKAIRKLIGRQEFTVKDSWKLLDRWTNIMRKMEDLEASRNMWKDRCLKLKEKIKK